MVFFRFVAEEHVEVTSADVLTCITSQRRGGDGRRLRAANEAAAPTRREGSRPRQGVPLVRSPRTLPRVLEPAEL